MTWGQYVFPFAQNPSNAIPQTIDYDLVIEEQYPGICLVPTVPGGIYSEIRVVDTCLWLVTNAMWNPNSQQWEQDSPCNPTLPAYAIEQCEDGSFRRLIAAPTNAINQPVTWETVFASDAGGNFSVTPATATNSATADAVEPTWNAGAAIMLARAVSVTDTASGAESALDQLSVNGVIKWKVRKDGLLEVGTVPASAIVGGIVQSLIAGTGIAVTNNGNDSWTIALSHGDYVDLPNAQTITGIKTIADGKSLLLGDATGAEGSIVGSSAAGMTAWGYGATFAAAPFTWKANAASACIIRIDPTNGFEFYHDTGLAVGNTYDPTLIFRIDDTGTVVTGTGITPAEIAADLEGHGGIVVSYDAGTDKAQVDGSAFIKTITSPDNSITINDTDPQNPTIEVASTAPVGSMVMAVGGGASASVVIPNQGTQWAVEVIFAFSAGSNNNATATITQTAGSALTGSANSGGVATQNAPYDSMVMLVGYAVQNETLDFTLGEAGSGSPFVNVAWSVKAVRTA